MNKNKIIFAVIGIIIVILIVVIMRVISSSKDNTGNQRVSGFTIWTLDDTQKFSTFLSGFQEMFPEYQDTQINVVGFQNYTEYYHSLIGAYLNGRAPDLFVLNNSEGKFFDSQLYPSSPEVFSVDEFRNQYDLVFSQDLIEVIPSENENIELLRGIPLGYQPMGMFYNFRELRGENISTWAYINDLVRRFGDEGKTLLGLGNGSKVQYMGDIIAQFFLQDNLLGINANNTNGFAGGISRYQLFGDANGENKFNMLAGSLNAQQNNIDLFSQGQVQMVFGYPELLEEIDEKGFNRSFLRGGVFPMHVEGSGNIGVDYNYFVINQNTIDMNLAQSIMKYFASEQGQQKYLDTFDFYFPSRLSLLSQRLEQTIKEGYPLKYKDFYNSSLDLVSFYKGNVSMFDGQINTVLDNSLNGRNLFENFRKTVLCISNKMITGENLGASCE